MNSPLCDCLVLWSRNGRLVAAAIELKSGSVDASIVRDQLQGGANLIDELARDLRPMQFFPILASVKMKAIELRAFKRFRIRFRGMDYRPIIVGCGNQLTQIVEKYS
jgi:hypothetical protein